MSEFRPHHERVRRLVEQWTRELVDNEEAVVVSAIVAGRTCVLEVGVDEDDVGKLVGKHGAHVNALRTLLAAVGGKEGTAYRIEVLE